MPVVLPVMANSASRNRLTPVPTRTPVTLASTSHCRTVASITSGSINILSKKNRLIAVHPICRAWQWQAVVITRHGHGRSCHRHQMCHRIAPGARFIRRWRLHHGGVIRRASGYPHAYGSAAAVGDAALGQVIRRDLHGNGVTTQDADVVLAHLAGDVSRYDMPVLQFDAESGVGQCLDDRAFHLDMLFFCHRLLSLMS